MSRLKYLRRKIDRIVSGKIFTYLFRRKLGEYKGKYNERRCFIIGNGPSLAVGDLEALGSEITFATNRIYHIYEQTDWRPSFYCIQDFTLIKEVFKDGLPDVLAKIDAFFAISLRSFWRFGFRKFNKKFFSLKIMNNVAFSNDILQYICEGKTVTYTCIQLARYMGFNEIILLGVDHSSSIVMRSGGQMEANDLKDYTSGIRLEGYTKRPYELDFVEQSYVAALDKSLEEGWRMLNATRGGNLQIFPRVSLEDLDL